MSKLAACLLALTVGCALVAAAAPARACDPAPSHRTSLVGGSILECVTFDGVESWTDGRLLVINDCDADLVLDVISCVRCDSSLVVGPGERAELVVEARGPDELADHSHSDQTYAWQLGASGGTIDTRVDYRDTSNACEDWDGGLACSQFAPAGSPARGALVVLLLLASYVARRHLYLRRTSPDGESTR